MPYFLITYDIAKDAQRNKVSKFLKQCGDRIQKSVFFINSSNSGIRVLEDTLKSFMENNDSLLILPCCRQCFSKATFTCIRSKSLESV